MCGTTRVSRTTGLAWRRGGNPAGSPPPHQLSQARAIPAVVGRLRVTRTPPKPTISPMSTSIAPSPSGPVAASVAGPAGGTTGTEVPPPPGSSSSALTVTGRLTTVPFTASVTTRATAPSMPSGTSTRTPARPTSSVLSTIAGSTVTVPTSTPSRLTVNVAGFGSVVENSSEERSTAILSPAANSAAGSDTQLTPTARWAYSGLTAPSAALKYSTMASKSTHPVSRVFAPWARAGKLSPPAARKEFAATVYVAAGGDNFPALA